jgi:CheY-like chemotaxis protein
MPKVLLDCGNCGPDFQAIRRMAEQHFGADVRQSHGADDTLDILRGGGIDLVTVNRKLDRDYSDGMEVVKAIKADPEVCSVPVMLVSNYPEYQQQAIAEGCVPGFGKLALTDPATLSLLEPYLAE